MIPLEKPAIAPLKPATIAPVQTAPAASDARGEQARQAAQRLEATFLSEMLKSAGFGTQTTTFSEGGEEDHFASFQRDAIAQHMVRAGGIVNRRTSDDLLQDLALPNLDEPKKGFDGLFQMIGGTWQKAFQSVFTQKSRNKHQGNQSGVAKLLAFRFKMRE